MAGKLTRAELYAFLEDPSTPPEALQRYFEIDESVAMRPRVTVKEGVLDEPLEALGFAIDVANWLSLKKRKRKFKRSLEEHQERLVAVSEGDSWFNFPSFTSTVREIIDQLLDRFSIASLDEASDELYNMFQDNEVGEKLTELKADGHEAGALLLSGGGNDMFGKFEQCLAPFSPGKPIEELLTNRFRSRFGLAVDHYHRLLEQIRGDHPDVTILIHGYSCPLPSAMDKGTHLRKPMDTWLEGASLDDEEKVRLMDELVRHIVDQFNDRLKCVEDKFGRPGPSPDLGGVLYLDLRPCVAANQWKDEIHPNNDGFANCAAKFRVELEEIERRWQATH